MQISDSTNIDGGATSMQITGARSKQLSDSTNIDGGATNVQLAGASSMPISDRTNIDGSSSLLIRGRDLDCALGPGSSCWSTGAAIHLKGFDPD